MKKVLFVVPQLSHGGSNKSLENILSKLDSGMLEIKVYSLETNEYDSPYYGVFMNHLIPQGIIYRIAVGVKLIRKILNAIQNYLNIDVWHYIYQIEADRIQKKEKSDVVIGFSENSQEAGISFATMNAQNVIALKIPQGKCVDFESFEPYTCKSIAFFVRSGQIELSYVGIRCFQNDMSKVIKHEYLDDNINKV